MFLGHFAAGFAAKKAAPGVSLGTLFLAVQLQDLLWPFFLLIGAEHVRISPGNTVMTPLDFYDYPFTHSLLGATLLAAALGALYWMARRDFLPSLVLSIAALSHWILDFITHRPDLPLTYDGGTKVGLGLWNSVGFSVGLELVMFAGGILLYTAATTAKNNTGRYGLAALVVLLGGIYAANVFGPPPPSVGAIAVAGNAMWIFVLLGYWIDRNRTIRKPQEPR